MLWNNDFTRHLPGDFHKDPADRMIVAIAYRRNLELITCDQKNSQLSTYQNTLVNAIAWL
ncbi:hypothetical protein ACX27_11190 [Nostoc piscinale CENA21]|uniref:PIN domain-containing protein n=1 Tax=Nostoc piscinale CENA21 TaxID=224013 RepID=A0A0M4TVX7_9NOSO|nr:hypothetical protein [Nostoc piscinale]ALF53276.1 hypothetical protein ACX27_11190 [Nostoc piscinale CENA21]